MERKTLGSVLAVAGGAVVIVIALVVANTLGSKKATVSPKNLAMTASIEQMLHGIPQQGTALGNAKAKVTLTE